MHALAIAVLLLLPLLVWVPLWLGDVDREPSNEITQEQPSPEPREHVNLDTSRRV